MNRSCQKSIKGNDTNWEIDVVSRPMASINRGGQHLSNLKWMLILDMLRFQITKVRDRWRYEPIQCCESSNLDESSRYKNRTAVAKQIIRRIDVVYWLIATVPGAATKRPNNSVAARGGVRSIIS
jgi:hypothetical protein